jgi:hypothetical protein
MQSRGSKKTYRHSQRRKKILIDYRSESGPVNEIRIPQHELAKSEDKQAISGSVKTR